MVIDPLDRGGVKGAWLAAGLPDAGKVSAVAHRSILGARIDSELQHVSQVGVAPWVYDKRGGRGRRVRCSNKRAISGTGGRRQRAARISRPTWQRHDKIHFRCHTESRVMYPNDLVEGFFERRPSPTLPFVLHDQVEVIDGVYAGKRGEVELLAYAKNPIEFLVEFGDGTDEYFPASSLRLLQRDT